jgi:co-chaperonin GroES (HSP10)
MKAVNYYIIVENFKKSPKKIAGLEITEKLDTENKYIKAKVISVGNKVEGIDVGNVIQYDKTRGHGITFEEKQYSVIQIPDVVIIE